MMSARSCMGTVLTADDMAERDCCSCSVQYSDSYYVQLTAKLMYDITE